MDASITKEFTSMKLEMVEIKKLLKQAIAGSNSGGKPP
jgi:hypothetical protein